MAAQTSASGSVRDVVSITRIRVTATWDARDGKPFGYEISAYNKETETDDVGMGFTLHGISKTGFDSAIKLVRDLFGKEIADLMVKCEASLDKNVDCVKVS